MLIGQKQKAFSKILVNSEFIVFEKGIYAYEMNYNHSIGIMAVAFSKHTE